MKRTKSTKKITEFLAKNNKDEVVINSNLMSRGMYSFKYIYGGYLYTSDEIYSCFIPHINTTSFDSITIIEDGLLRHILDKPSGKLTDVTELITKIDDLTKENKKLKEKFQEQEKENTETINREKTINLTNSITMKILKTENEELKEELDKLKQPKKTVAKKNVKKTPKNDEKNVKKKATKKKVG